MSASQEAQKGNKMLKKIFSFFHVDYQTTLEDFIKTRNPQSTADLERLERQFERLCRSGYF